MTEARVGGLERQLPQARRGPQAAFRTAEARAPRLGGTAAVHINRNSWVWPPGVNPRTGGPIIR